MHVTESPDSRIRLRAIVIALLIIPVNAYWVTCMEAIKYTGHPTTYSLFFNVVILLGLLLGLNALIGRFTTPPLTRADLMVVYFMVALATALAGHDQAQVLMGVLVYPIFKSTPENHWLDTFGPHLPKYLLPRDPVALRAFFVGHSSFFEHWRAWVVPLGMWALFTLSLLTAFLCLSTVLRRQWVENERLTFPLVALPLEMVQPELAFFRHRLMWIAFCIPAFINVVNNLHQWYPGLPEIGMRTKNLGMYLNSGPWRAISWTPLFVFPFAIGIGYLLPLDVLGSSWIFYWCWKLQRVVGAYTGLTNGHPNAPYIPEQAYGGYLALAAVCIYAGRHHLKRVVLCAFGQDNEYAKSRREAVPYALAFWGFLASFTFLVWFSRQIGMEYGPIFAVFVGYFAISIAVGRLRAEFGSPTHDLHDAYPGGMLPRIFGPTVFTPKTLTGFAFYHWFNRAHRSHPLPVQLESLVAAGRLGADQRKMAVAMVLAALVGLISAYIAVLDPHYRFGADSAKTFPLLRYFGNEAWGRLTSQLNAPTHPEIGSLWGIVVGFVTCTLLFVCRLRWVGFPLHPVGFAVSSSWSMDQVWLSLLLAWTAKTLIVRYGGLKLYRKAVPFFLGLILGDFVSGGLFNLVGIFWDLPVYHFLG